MKEFRQINLGAVYKRAWELTNYLLAITGIIVSLVSFILMLTSRTTRLWVKSHPNLIFTLLVGAVIIIFIQLNVVQSLNNRYRTLRSLHPPGPQPTDHDRKLVREFLVCMPPAGDLVRWLKLEFNPVSVSLELVQTLSATIRCLDFGSVDFDDHVAAASYLDLRAAAGAFSQKVQQWTSLEAGDTRRIIPTEWEFEEHGKYQLAASEIQNAHNRLRQAYDDFLHICHERRIEG